MHFALNLAFLHMIQELWPGNFSHLSPNLTQEVLSFPLGLSTNADFRKQNPNASYSLHLLQEPTSLTALHSSLEARSKAHLNRICPFSFSPRQEYPVGHLGKGSFLFHLALHIFYFSSGVIVFLSIGPQIYAWIKQGKLKALVASMALYKLPTTEAVNDTLYMAEFLVSTKGQAKYVCLDPWINALLTLASLSTIITYMIMRCRKCTLCRGLEYATACHIYVFISKNERYSPIKLCSTTGLLYNFVTSQKLPMEALELNRGCPWDSLRINWREVTLTNGYTQIRLPYNVQVPLKEKTRLCNLMKGADFTAHLMVLQGHTWYTVSNTPLHYPAMQMPFSPGSMNPLPLNTEEETA